MKAQQTDGQKLAFIILICIIVRIVLLLDNEILRVLMRINNNHYLLNRTLNSLQSCWF